MRKKLNYKNILTKEFLIKKYIKTQKSYFEIAENVGCSYETVRRYIKKYNISIRSVSEAIKIKFQNKEYKKKYLQGKEKINHKGKNNPAYNEERHCNYYCIALNCNNKICYENWKFGKRRCRSCAQKLFQDKKAPNYIDGRSYFPYPQEFNSALKLNIRERDNYTCQKCGITEEEHIMIYGQVLEVHHIDYNKQNCDKENLITACKQCNLRANSNRIYWKSYFKKIVEVNYA